MDNILVVFYTYTGVSRRAAQLLATHRGWPVGEVWDADPRAGLLGGLRCIFDSLFQRRPAIRYEGPDPAGFQTVIIISPIWAYRMAGPMRSFLAENAPKLPRFAVVTLMNAAGATNAVKEAEQLVGRRAISTLDLLSRDFKDGSATARLLQFGEAVDQHSSNSSKRDLTQAGDTVHA